MCGAGSSRSGALGFPGAHHYRRNPRLRLVQFSGRWARRGYLRPRLLRRALGGPAEGDPAPRRWNPPGVSALRGVWGQMAPARGAPGRSGGERGQFPGPRSGTMFSLLFPLGGLRVVGARTSAFPREAPWKGRPASAYPGAKSFLVMPRPWAKTVVLQEPGVRSG